MRRFIRKIFAALLLIVIVQGISHAKTSVKLKADVNTEFTIKNKDLPDEISFKVKESRTIPYVVSIPEDSYITLEIIKAQRELRWHKRGLILCKLKSYTPEGVDVPIDVSDKDIYLVVRKHEDIDKKEAFLIGTELVIAQGASFFAPGVDIGYYFIKGAIQREKDPNWFRAGVHNAYDNSIFWFCLKGKPIELTDGEQVQIKEIKTKKVEKFTALIDKRNARFERQAAKRITKKDARNLKRQLKREKRMAECSVVESAIEDIIIDKKVTSEIIDSK